MYVFESQNSADGGVVNVHGTTMFGVQLRNLDLVVATYDKYPKTKLAWARMLKNRRPPTDGWPVVFARYDGALYDNWLDLAAAACAPCGGSSGAAALAAAETARTDKSAANVFRDLGAPPPGVNPEDVIPSDYLEKPDGRDHVRLRRRVPVLFEPAVVFTAYPKPGAAYDAEGCGCIDR